MQHPQSKALSYNSLCIRNTPPHDPKQVKPLFEMAIHFDDKQSATSWWGACRRFSLFLLSMWGTWILANVLASLLIGLQYETSALCEHWEPWVFQEMKQPAEALLTWLISFVLWVCCYAYMYVPISTLIEVLQLSPRHCALEAYLGYRFYVISFPKTTETKAIIPPSAPQLKVPSLGMNIAAEVQSALEPAWSSSDWALSNVTTLERPRTHHDSGNRASLQTPRSDFINKTPTILSRKRPCSRLSILNPQLSSPFSSRLDDDPALHEKSMGLRTLFGQACKNGMGLELARSETKKEKPIVPSSKWPSLTSQPRSTHRSSRQSSVDHEQLRSSSWPPPKLSILPHLDVKSPVSTTPSTGLSPSLDEVTRNVTSRMRAQSHSGRERPSTPQRDQYYQFDLTPPSSPRSDAAIPYHGWLNKDSAHLRVSKWRGAVSTIHGEPSSDQSVVKSIEGDLWFPETSDSEYYDCTGGNQGSEH